MGKQWKQCQTLFFWAPKSLQMVTAAMKLKDTYTTLLRAANLAVTHTMTKDEMAGWHHWLHGCESEWTPGVGEGQGGLVCCDSWDGKKLDTTEQMNWTAVILEPKKIKSDTVSTVSPSISHEVMGPDAMIFVFWMLSFKPTFSSLLSVSSEAF